MDAKSFNAPPEVKPSFDKPEDTKKYTDDVAPTNSSQAFDFLLSSVGNDGKWQWKMTALCSLCGVFTGMQNFAAVFLAATPNHWCDIVNTSKYTNENIHPMLYEEIRNFSTPWERGKDGSLIGSMCYYLDRGMELDQLFNGSSLNSWMNSTSIPDHGDTRNLRNDSEKLACSKWDYDKTKLKSTVITEWNLVCDEQWLKPTIQATYMIGILVGAVVISAFSDGIGRRPSMICSALLFFICSAVAAFSPYLWLFMALRFIIAATGQGMFLISFVMVMEIVGLKSRNIFGIFHGTSFVIGNLFLATFAYFLRDWRSLQLAMGAPTVVLLAYYWFLPESPRWLLMNGKTEGGINVLKTIGKGNGGKKLPEENKLKHSLDIIEKEILMQKKISNGSLNLSRKFLGYFQQIYKLVATPNMRKRSLIIFYNWFVVSMCFYGVAFSGENINVSLYGLISIGALVDIPAVIVLYYSFRFIGRRITLSYSMILGGLCCAAILAVPTEMSWLNLSLALVGRSMFGLAFRCVFFFSSELVPTDIRNNSMGVASFFARLGSILAPYIVDLMGNIYYAIPSTIFGVLAVIAGILALLLPDTSKLAFPETIAEIESLPR